MPRTQMQRTGAKNSAMLGGVRRASIGAAAFVCCATVCLAADEVSKKDEAATSTPKASSAAESSKASKASKGDKAWSSESAATKAIPRRPRPNVNLKDSAAVASAVDKMILQNLTESGTQPAPRADAAAHRGPAQS